MGQVVIRGADAALRMESLVPGDIQILKPGRARYTMLTNDEGGIRDDLIVTRTEDGLFVVVNAGCRDADIALIRSTLEPVCEVEEIHDRALIALQGPAAIGVVARMCPEVADLAFMQSAVVSLSGLDCRVSRLGYTGEDGCEISVAADHAVKLARTLLASEEVAPAGLGARDSLRLEAGGCALYGKRYRYRHQPHRGRHLAWDHRQAAASRGRLSSGHERIRCRAAHTGPGPEKLVGPAPGGARAGCAKARRDSQRRRCDRRPR